MSSAGSNIPPHTAVLFVDDLHAVVVVQIQFLYYGNLYQTICRSHLNEHLYVNILYEISRLLLISHKYIFQLSLCGIFLWSLEYRGLGVGTSSGLLYVVQHYLCVSAELISSLESFQFSKYLLSTYVDIDYKINDIVLIKPFATGNTLLKISTCFRSH